MNPSEIQMLVLAGGFGSRLQSVLHDTPKALAPVGGEPFLALQLGNWISQGVRSFVFLLHHQADRIVTFLDGMKTGLLKECTVRCLVEPVPLDTGGAIAHAVRELGLEADFLVANADTWLGSGIRELLQTAAPAMAVVHLNDCSRYGRLRIDDRHRITAFDEKTGLPSPGWINAGMYRLDATAFKSWDGTRFSLERQLFPVLAGTLELSAVAIEGDFIDIGIPDDYRKFSRWVETGRRGSLCN